MTKEAYFDMCEQLGSDPIEAEIPISLEDFPTFVQDCFVIYSRLRDIFDGMSGAYFGKDYSIVFRLFELYHINDLEEQRLAMDILNTMDVSRSKILANKKASAKK